LERVLDAIELQTYPTALIEVVLCDDGSDQPVQVAERPFPVTVVRLEKTPGFGAGRARNAAAERASGSVLLFLDADVVPERQVVASYLRWFSLRRDVVPMGLCRFVEMDDLPAEVFRDLLRVGGLSDMFEGRDVDDQAWRENTFGRTADLTIEAADAFRVVVGATFAVAAEMFVAVGGFRELGIRGIEDTELGYRLHNRGAILILDRDAAHWHQGRRNMTQSRRAQIDEVRAPFVRQLLPVRGFRKRRPEPIVDTIDFVPRVIVHLLSDVDPASEAGVLLRSGTPVPDDCVVVFGDGDPSSTSSLPHVPAFAHLFVPESAHISAGTIDLLLAVLHDKNLGRVVIESNSGDQPVIFQTSRARARAARFGPGQDWAELNPEFQTLRVDPQKCGVSWGNDALSQPPLSRTWRRIQGFGSAFLRRVRSAMPHR
jgi:GT2 family glycosyltransferase